MTAMASQITSLTLVYSTAYSGAYQRKHQSSASLAFVRGIHRSPVNSLHKGPVTRKMFPFDDVIMPWPILRISVISFSCAGSRCSKLRLIPWSETDNFSGGTVIFLFMLNLKHCKTAFFYLSLNVIL